MDIRLLKIDPYYIDINLPLDDHCGTPVEA